MWQRVSAVYTTLARGTGSLTPRMSSPSRALRARATAPPRRPSPRSKSWAAAIERVGYPLTFLQYPTLYSSVTRTSHLALNPSRVPVKNIERSSRCQYTQRARGRGGARCARVNIRARGRTSRAPPRARFDWYTGTLREFGSISNFGDWEPLLAPTGALGGISCWICLGKGAYARSVFVSSGGDWYGAVASWARPTDW